MIAALTGMGLSAAAGLNAYIPFLIVAGLARFTDVITLPATFSWMESTPALIVGTVLLATEVVLDKVPAVDTINDAVQTFIRPSMGGLVFAATSAADKVDSSTWMQENSWVGVVLGIIVSGLVHAGKATARPAIDAGTLGVATPFVSATEDAGSTGLSLVAIFSPVLVIVGLIILAYILYRLVRTALRMRRKLRGTMAKAGSTGQPEPPPGPAA